MKQNSSTKDLNLSSNERLFIHNKSKFAPKNYQNLLPDGLKIYTFHSGLKKASEDLLIIIFDELTNSKSVYSKTSTPSAPIIWDKKYNKGKKEIGEGIIIIFASKDDKIGLAVGVTTSLNKKYNAVDFAKKGSEIIGGKGGGGRPDFAQAGGVDTSKIDEALEKLKSLI